MWIEERYQMVIVKLPIKKYAVFSNMIDDFTLLFATREQCIQFLIDRQVELLRLDYNSMFDKIESGEGQMFTITLEEALKRIRAVHGEEHLKRMLDDIEKKE